MAPVIPLQPSSTTKENAVHVQQHGNAIKQARRACGLSCFTTTEDVFSFIETQFREEIRCEHRQTACEHAGSAAGRQCTREGVGTGSLGLVTTLALLLIWRDRVDRQVGRETDGTVTEVTRLSAQTVGPSSSCCGGNGRESARETQPKSQCQWVSLSPCTSQICDKSSWVNQKRKHSKTEMFRGVSY